jgi:hypothetical protein
MYLTLAQKFQVAEAIKKVQQTTPNGLTYQPGWSDIRIAREFGIKPNQVATVRKGAFQNMVSRVPRESKGDRFQKLVATISTLEQRITDLENAFTSRAA